MQARLAGPQPPVTELLKNTVAPVAQLVALATMLDEQVKCTTGHGLTVTRKLQLVVAPQPSVAVQVTVVVPAGKLLPLGGLQATFGGGRQPPLAVLL